MDWNWNARIRRHPLTRFWLPSVLHRLQLIDVNIDWPPDLVLHDIRKRLPFQNSTADYIFASNVLEHLKKCETIQVLKDCHRILKAKGIIRIVVPDLQLLALKYVTRDHDFYYKTITYAKSSGDTFADRFLAFFYEESNKKSIRSLKQRIKSLLFANPYHKWLYDYESLSTILSQIGFKDIKRCTAKKGKAPDLDRLEGSHLPENLHVEARK